MSACEKCWGDAFARMMGRQDGRSQTEHYRDLLQERKDTPCTPEEQAGTEAFRESIRCACGQCLPGQDRECPAREPNVPNKEES